jgi:hypothetical protein
MDKLIFQVPAEIVKVETLSDQTTIRLKVDTIKELTAEEEALIMQLRKETGWFVFSKQEIEQDDLKDLPAIESIKGKKSQGQRLRGVLYRLWEQGTQVQTPEQFYDREMEKIIEHFKGKLL